MIGNVLQNTYRIEQLIGRGSSGSIYEAAHLRMSRHFAVKMLDPTMAKNTDALNRCWHEIELVSSMEHPHILQVYDCNVTPDGDPYVIAELLEGDDLASLLQAGPLDLNRAVEIFKQTASALQAAHEKAVIHQNLKPQNIFLCRGEGDGASGTHVKVVDFGISKLSSLGTEPRAADDEAHAQTGRLPPIESYYYLAPEQVHHGGVDRRTDVFALGAILYEMLCGRPPFTAGSIPLLVQAIINEAPAPLSSLRSDLPERATQVVEKALQKRPADRYSSMETFWSELAEAVDYTEQEQEPEPPAKGNTLHNTDPLLGTKVGNYMVSSMLGEGGMGAVYKAEHPEIGRKVAIKVLGDHLMQNRMAAERFISEAKAVARLDHPNVIDIYDFGRLDDGRPYYVMEFLEGHELYSLMEERGKLPAAEVLPYLEQICAALQTAHETGIIHRDMKPENVFILDRQPLGLKLLDFGIAKVLEADGKTANLTATGMVMGSPLTIAPEQAAGMPEKISPRTDLYSLGVILYWMLAGLPPFSGEASGILVAKHITEVPPPLHDKEPTVPPAVAQVVDRCLAKEPEQRPGSADELARAFREAVAASAGWEPDAALLRSRALQEAQRPAQEGPDTTMRGAAGEVVVSQTYTDEALPKSSMAKWFVIGAAAVIVICLGAVLVYLATGKKETTDPDSDKVVAAGPSEPGKSPEPKKASTPTPTPKPTPAPKPADKAKKVRITLKIEPRSAQVYLDGKLREDNPLVLPASKETHKLKVKAEGHEPSEKTITADADRTIQVILSKKKAPPPVVAVKPDPAPKPKPKPKPKPRPVVKKRPVPVVKKRPVVKKKPKKRPKKKRGPRFDSLDDGKKKKGPRFNDL